MAGRLGVMLGNLLRWFRLLSRVSQGSGIHQVFISLASHYSRSAPTGPVARALDVAAVPFPAVVRARNQSFTGWRLSVPMYDVVAMNERVRSESQELSRLTEEVGRVIV